MYKFLTKYIHFIVASFNGWEKNINKVTVYSESDKRDTF